MLGNFRPQEEKNDSGAVVKWTAGIRIRAARRTTEGMLLEVGEIPLLDPPSGRITAYWFLFENERLVQWGRPEDWRSVSARYQIDFNPSPAVPLR